MAYYIIDGRKIPYLKYDIDKIIDKLEREDSNEKNKKGEDFDIDKKKYTKHILIERTLTVEGYEFNFIDLETKEFYWSYYNDSLDYNSAKEDFLFKSGFIDMYKNIKSYLEE